MTQPGPRLEPRIVFEAPVRIRTAAGDEVKAQAKNLSLSGLFVSVPEACEVGTELVCDVPLPERGDRALRGRVAWVRPASHADHVYVSGMGIEFVDLSDSDEEALREAVGARSAAGQSVVVLFEGMKLPVLCEATLTGDGLRLGTGLPFLRLGSDVEITYNRAGVRRTKSGTLHAVELSPSQPGEVPRIQVDVHLGNGITPAVAREAYKTPAPVSPEAAAVRASVHDVASGVADPSSHAASTAGDDQSTAADRDVWAPTMVPPAEGAPPAAMPSPQTQPMGLAGEPEAPVALATATVGAMPAPTVAAPSRSFGMDGTPLPRWREMSANLGGSVSRAWRSSQNARRGAYALLGTVLITATLWAAWPGGGSTQAPEIAAPDFPDRGVTAAGPKAAITTTAATAADSDDEATPTTETVPASWQVPVTARPSPRSASAEVETTAGSPEKTTAKDKVMAKATTRPRPVAGALPEIIRDGNHASVVIPLKGSNADAVTYELDDPFAIVVNLPSADPIGATGHFKIGHDGFRQIWVEKRPGKMHVRFLLNDPPPPHKLDIGADRITIKLTVK